jgi:putative transposase
MSETPAIRPYQPNSYYHIYNRGAHHNPVFREGKDFWVFRRIVRQTLEKYLDDIHLRCFSMSPNHYHLEPFQKHAWSISKMMQKIGIRYARFFNKKYNLSGQIFEAKFQCKMLPTEEDVLRVERYILNNPMNAGFLNWPHVGHKI